MTTETYTFMGKTFPKMTGEEARSVVASMKAETPKKARMQLMNRVLTTPSMAARFTSEALDVYRQALAEDRAA